MTTRVRSMSILAIVILLSFFWKVESDAPTNLLPTTTSIQESGNNSNNNNNNNNDDDDENQRKHHRWMRESYRRPGYPIFATENIDERVSLHESSRNWARKDDKRHQRVSKKANIISSISVVSSIKSSKTSVKSSKKNNMSSKKGSGNIFITERPTDQPTFLPTTTVSPTSPPSTTAAPSSSQSPTDSSRPTAETNPTTTNPTTNDPAPSPPGVSNAPTGGRNDFPIEVSKYSLLFFFDDTTSAISTTDEDFLELGDATRSFLDDYFGKLYKSTSLISFTEVQTRVTSFTTMTLPIRTFFLTTVLFSESSIFYPPKSEVEQEINEAFSQFQSNREYVDAVRRLRSSNVFSTISSVTFGGYDV